MRIRDARWHPLSLLAARAKVAKEFEAVDAGSVLIGECEVHGVIAHQFRMQSPDVCGDAVLIECADAGPFIAASSAGAVLPQVAKSVKADVTVIPDDFELVLSNLLQCSRCCSRHKQISPRRHRVTESRSYAP